MCSTATTPGFPNGRRLTDDVIDASLQVVEGELVGSKNDLGDAVDKNDKDFEKSFPYVALPTEGSRGAARQGHDRGQRRPQPARGRAASRRVPPAPATDTSLIAGSAGAGAAGILLIGAGADVVAPRCGDRAY